MLLMREEKKLAMKQSDPLQLVESGTLVAPGPIGRAVRVVIGAACLYALYQLIIYRGPIVALPISHVDNIWPMLIVPLFIINPVVNIGFGVSWGRWPSYVSVIALTLIALCSRVLTSTFDNAIFGAGLWLWLVYFYTHIGLSFTLAGVAATPGCEMRAPPDLIGKLIGRPAQEHHCPAFIGKIDNWELQRRDR